jgi:hypothetical protein
MALNWNSRVLYPRRVQGWALCGDGSDCERSRDSETTGDAILLVVAVVPGGRVELPTPAFSGPRSTGELPRHFGRQEILRVTKLRSKC